ncbi:MAG TPA: hypothetical protein VF484_06715 [Candidatus Limnocylindrales bacterium]
MSKSLVTRLFLGGVIAVVAGAIAATVLVLWGFASGGFVVSGHDVVGLDGTGFTWSLIGLLVASGFVMLGGIIAGIIAWIGALLNTSQLADKTWFVLLLVLGLLSFGVFAMIAYVIAGPDGSSPTVGQPTPPSPSVNVSAHA